jgi:hypothetical protein
MATAPPPQGTTGSNTDSHAQFWDDFWNTLYQFTHPFSSTFFDTVFSAEDPTSSSNSQHGQQPAPDKPASRFFKDEASFRKFWQGLQNGTPDGSSASEGGSLLGNLQTAWIDFKSASSGFIEAVRVNEPCDASSHPHRKE